MGAAVSLHIRHKQANKNLVRRLFFYSQEHLINLHLVSDFFSLTPTDTLESQFYCRIEEKNKQTRP